MKKPQKQVEKNLAKDCKRCDKCCLEPYERACWDYAEEPIRTGAVVPKSYREADMF